MVGWIKLHRQILECDLWIGFDDEEPEPFDKRSAWIDLLLRANHKDKEMIFNYEPMTVTRGQLITSVRKLSARWGWSVTKTYRYLSLLEGLGMIVKQSDNQKTLLTIVNYGVYQDLGNTDETQTEHERNTNVTQSGHKQEYKEIKKERNINIKHKHGTYNNVLLSDEEYQKLVTEFPNDYQERVDNLSAYMKSTGKSYKDHLATIRNWARRDQKNKPTDKVNKFNDYKQNTYDFAELEKRFISN